MNEAMTKAVLITDKVHECLISGLVGLGFRCDYLPDSTLAAVREMVGNYDGIVINSKIIVDESFLQRAKKLQFIGRLGSGLEIIDLQAARARGVAVFSAPEGNCNAVAEHALGMLLALANNFRKGDREVRQFVWEREENRGFEIAGQTVGIVGFGHTGRQFAKKLSGLGVQVLAYDKYLPKGYALDFGFVKEATIEEIVAQASILSLHLPLTAETKHWANFELLQRFRQPIVLLNTSRGNVIPTADLVRALELGIVRAAGLDVFENEKPQTMTDEERKLFGRLYGFDNVLLTPHVAGWTHESLERLATVLLQKISAYLQK